MLIPFDQLLLTKQVKGVIHVGAHECEERNGYLYNFNLDDSKIIWIDAISEKVNLMKSNNPNLIIFNECVSNKDGEDVSFMVTNNYQSSSMLNFKTHAIEHSQIVETHRLQLKTKTINTIFTENNLNPENYNFLNLDIQGAELLALKGSSNILPHIDYIYSEINVNELYENCVLIDELDDFLDKNGFQRIQTQMTHHGWGDAFYVKKNT